MKRSIFILLAMLASWSFTSCEVDMNDNGDLDGFWQLARVDTIGGGSQDMVPSRLFWSFQSRLLQVSDLSYSMDSYLFRFNHVGNELHVSQPYKHDYIGSDVPVTEPKEYEPYGISGLDEHFYVEQLDGDRMQLSSKKLRLLFNRF